MSNPKAPNRLPEPDFEAIEKAMMETERGRWFLTEFARRNRNSDTGVLLEAIAKLQSAVAQPSENRTADKIRVDLVEMSKAIAQTRQEIASIRPDENNSTQFMEATEELEAIVRSAEKATNDILEAAEEIQETAWLMREQGSDAENCDRLDSRATDIYTACSFQDLTGQRTTKVINVLQFLEERVNAMVDILGMAELDDSAPQIPQLQARPDAHLLNGPQLDGRGLEQNDIDTMMADNQQQTSLEASLETPAETAPPQISTAPATFPEPENNALTTQSQSMLEKIARSAEADDDLMETSHQPAPPKLPSMPPAPPAPPAAKEQTDSIIEPQQSAGLSDAEENLHDPDDLLGESTLTAPGSPATVKAAPVINDPDVMTEDEFEEPEPLTLSVLDPSSRSALFC